MNLEFDLAAINKTAALFWEEVKDSKVFAFHGQMGAGKTTFIHALCDAKKVSSTVGSPTFSLINEYRYPQGLIYHIDLYRLNSDEEAIRAGVEDCLYSDHICFVEWPEKAPSIFPENTVHVFIDSKNTTERSLRIANI